MLTRECPECGFDARTVGRADVVPLIAASAGEWRQVLVQHPHVRRRPSDGVWSPLEYGCHVRDVFRVFDERLHRMLTEDDPTYDSWDQDAAAVADVYDEQDPDEVADELGATAHRLAARFAAVEGAQWDRTGSRSDGARFTVETLARYLVHEPVHHLYDVGRPLPPIP